MRCNRPLELDRRWTEACQSLSRRVWGLIRRNAARSYWTSWIVETRHVRDRPDLLVQEKLQRSSPEATPLRIRSLLPRGSDSSWLGETDAEPASPGGQSRPGHCIPETRGLASPLRTRSVNQVHSFVERPHGISLPVRTKSGTLGSFPDGIELPICLMFAGTERVFLRG